MEKALVLVCARNFKNINVGTILTKESKIVLNNIGYIWGRLCPYMHDPKENKWLIIEQNIKHTTRSVVDIKYPCEVRFRGTLKQAAAFFLKNGATYGVAGSTIVTSDGTTVFVGSYGKAVSGHYSTAVSGAYGTSITKNASISVGGNKAVSGFNGKSITDIDGTAKTGDYGVAQSGGHKGKVYGGIKSLLVISYLYSREERKTHHAVGTAGEEGLLPYVYYRADANNKFIIDDISKVNRQLKKYLNNLTEQQIIEMLERNKNNLSFFVKNQISNYVSHKNVFDNTISALSIGES